MGRCKVKIVSLCLFLSILFCSTGLGRIVLPNQLMVPRINQIERIMRYNGTRWLHISRSGKKVHWEFKRHHSRQLVRIFK